MDEDQVSRAIDDIERGLQREDPTFVRGLRDVRRGDEATVLFMLVLLATGAVLLVTGMATRSWATCAAGLAALAASLLVDDQRRRLLRRTR